MNLMSRRSLVSGVFGAVVTSVWAKDAASAESRASDDGAMCLVYLSSSEMLENKARARKHDGSEVWVNIMGFPTNWNFNEGDLLLYDSVTGDAWPHVRMQRSLQRGASSTAWTALNIDQRYERPIATDSTQVGTVQ